MYQDKVKSFDDMTNLSLELREILKENYTICNFKILKKQESSDGTKKYLFDVLDGNAIETVLMSYHHGYSICVSSQIGCKMGCKFCASTGIKFVRSLTSGEIVEQILAVEQDENYKKSKGIKYWCKTYKYFYKLFSSNDIQTSRAKYTMYIINITSCNNKWKT